MDGYECIRNMPDPKISRTFGVGILEAVAMRNGSRGALSHGGAACPEMLGVKGPCRDRVSSCAECIRGFLENEVPM